MEKKIYIIEVIMLLHPLSYQLSSCSMFNIRENYTSPRELVTARSWTPTSLMFQRLHKHTATAGGSVKCCKIVLQSTIVCCTQTMCTLHNDIN